MNTEDVKISVDQEVFAVLQSMAEPLIDTPNTVLRRVLGLDDRAGPTKPSRMLSGSKPKARAASGALLPEVEYEIPLLRALVAAGGQGPSGEIIDAVGRELGDRLTAQDRERLTSGDVRWRNRTQFVRLRLVQRGLMDGRKPRGVWAITQDGRRFLREEG